eukprot:CAMPEP_0114335986 /NCGR_PEP_ID=MMETSP0101-20121206/5410_1 /TAXON_ID=38822 ORGANISM="Pteridomonas danica, Strain PT" /NCGR_SAMPLE_ID=MMETSP0101 /ASSEMBLY_ACC=CAM_ASM_000211 /LENGTH=93 /DNA_ID=CAMNT_0001467767 /DNA_START=64 /DNA_END=345 /DNA_ORIENTATION=+
MFSTLIRTTSKRCSSSLFVREFATYYAQSHEYINVNGGVGTVGITAHAADALGDIVFLELPEVGNEFEQKFVDNHIFSIVLFVALHLKFIRSP